MTIKLYDPKPLGNEYASFYFNSLCDYGAKNGFQIERVESIDDAKNCALLILTDYLLEDVILKLKNNGVRIVGFNVTDSSYISGACRYAPSLRDIDLIFSLTGIQKINYGHEFEVDPDFNIKMAKKQFLPEKDWQIFSGMRDTGQLQSLPYVPWTPMSPAHPRPYHDRSQKVLIRGGGHARRFILGLFLIQKGLLDINSGMVLSPYFQEGMNPAFRFCSECRAIYKAQGKFHAGTWISPLCENPHAAKINLSNLGEWNNKCPASFFRMANHFSKTHGQVPVDQVEAFLNCHWLHPDQNMDLLSRITFTSDLKWLFSIYAAQRFWEAASAGCINVLPSRTTHQEYFPDIQDGEDYITYSEDMSSMYEDFGMFNQIDYDNISRRAMHTYNKWIKPTDYAINTNLLAHIFTNIKIVCDC